MAAPIRLTARVGKSKVFSRNLGIFLLNRISHCKPSVYEHVASAEEGCLLGRFSKHISAGTPILRWFVLQHGTRTCWNCNETLSPKDLLCKSCDTLQEVNENRNYFEVFGEVPRYDIDEKKLQQTFRDLQRILHPDRFTKKSQKEKKYSEDHSSFVNLAYQVISKPEKRAFYLLRLHDKDLDSVQLDPAFLAYMMELNEQLSDEKEGLAQRLVQEVTNNLEDLHNEMSASFAKNELDKACLALAKIRYYRNIENKIKELLGHDT